MVKTKKIGSRYIKDYVTIVEPSLRELKLKNSEGKYRVIRQGGQAGVRGKV